MGVVLVELRQEVGLVRFRVATNLVLQVRSVVAMILAAAYLRQSEIGDKQICLDFLQSADLALTHCRELRNLWRCGVLGLLCGSSSRREIFRVGVQPCDKSSGPRNPRDILHWREAIGLNNPLWVLHTSVLCSLFPLLV